MPDSIETAYADRRLIMSVEAAAFHEPVYRCQAEDCQPKLRAMRPTGWRWTASPTSPRAGKPTAVHQRYGGTGAAVRHPADLGEKLLMALITAVVIGCLIYRIERNRQRR